MNAFTRVSDDVKFMLKELEATDHDCYHNTGDSCNYCERLLQIGVDLEKLKTFVLDLIKIVEHSAEHIKHCALYGMGNAPKETLSLAAKEAVKAIETMEKFMKENQ